MIRDFTKGPIVRPLLLFALPIIAANLLQTFYNLVDTFWVGRLGGEALAAVGVGSVLYMFILSFSWGFSASATALVSQYFGAGQRDELGKISANMIVLYTTFSTIAAAIMFIYREPLLVFLGAGPEFLDEASLYLGINLLGTPVAYMFTLLGAILRGVGDSVTPLKVVALGNGINVALDPILIFGLGPIPAMGVAGAAWATVASRLIAVIWGLTFLQAADNPTRVSRGDWQLDYRLIGTATKVGTPAGAANLLNTLGGSLLLRLVSPFGTAAMAAHTVGIRIASLATMPAVALGMGASNWVGQNLGADQRERAFHGAHVTVGVTFGMLLLVGLLLFLPAQWVVAVFAPGETDVIGFGGDFIKILAFSWAFFGTQIVVSQILRGAGDTWVNLALSGANLLLFRYPAAFIVSRYMDQAQGVWWGIFIGDVLISAVAYTYFRGRRWMDRAIVKSGKGKGQDGPSPEQSEPSADGGPLSSRDPESAPAPAPAASETDVPADDPSDGGSLGAGGIKGEPALPSGGKSGRR